MTKAYKTFVWYENRIGNLIASNRIKKRSRSVREMAIILNCFYVA